MDCRDTLSAGGAFKTILRNCAEAGQKIAMLLDEDGLTRAEGFIQSAGLDATDPYIELDNGKRISCNSIVAVNGIFLDQYSQC